MIKLGREGVELLEMKVQIFIEYKMTTKGVKGEDGGGGGEWVEVWKPLASMDSNPEEYRIADGLGQ